MASPIDDYLDGFTGEHRQKLEQLRDAIRATVPEASEKISYGMPTWHLGGNLVHIAAFTRHVSLFPGPAGVAAFADELAARGLITSKGTIQFPLGADLPLDLVQRIVEFRAAQQRGKRRH